MIYKKCRENPKNILFIDASNYFEKVGNKNNLREDDIERIVSTYRKRTENDKYSHLATFEEIRKNDYNLNISRYVDTFEAEKVIDIDAVAKQIQELEMNTKDIDSKILGYCKELGITSPF